MGFELDPKVRVNVPEFLHEILCADAESFNLPKNRLCNEVFRHYADKEIKLSNDINIDCCKTLQFTLNQDNLDFFAAVCDTIQINNKADYFRKLFYRYANQPRFLREQAIFSKTTLLIQEAIQHQRGLKIRYKDEYRDIEPFALARSDGETRNYVFCYCHRRNSYTNYRLSNIKGVSVLDNHLQTHYDPIYISEIKNNFDPFLSYGKRVKVRLSQEGRKIYQRNITHRPKLLEEDGDTYTFECSELKAQLYFPQFMEHAELLEPLELRKWFQIRVGKIIALYGQLEF